MEKNFGKWTKKTILLFVCGFVVVVLNSHSDYLFSLLFVTTQIVFHRNIWFCYNIHIIQELPNLHVSILKWEINRLSIAVSLKKPETYGIFSGNLADSIFQAQASQIFKKIEKFKDTHSILVMMMKIIKSYEEKQPLIRITPNTQGQMLG